MSDYESASFPMVGGVETQLADFTLPAPHLAVAENVYVERRGALRKRSGTAALTTSTVDAGVTSAAPAALVRYKNALLMFDAATTPNVYEYSEAAARWTEHGNYAPGVTQSAVIVGSGNDRGIWQHDADRTSNGYMLTAQVEDGLDDGSTYNTTVRVTLQDPLGTFVCNRMQIFSNNSGATVGELTNLRVVALGTQFYVFFGDAANRDLRVWLLDTATAATITAAIGTSGAGGATASVIVAANLHATGLPAFDACASGVNGVFLAYRTTTALQITIGFVSAAGVLAGTTNLATVADATAVAVTAQSANIHGVVYMGGPYAVIMTWNGTGWITLATSTILDTFAAASGIFFACRFDDALVLRVWYTTANTVYQAKFSTAGVVTSRDKRLRLATLQSRPFLAADGLLYYWAIVGYYGGSGGTVQPTHFLIASSTGLPVAQANVGVAAANTMSTVVDTGAYYSVPLAYVTRILTNEVAWAAGGENIGIRKIDWYLTHAQSHKTAEVGDSIYLAGSILQQYDGVSCVENGFLRYVESDKLAFANTAGGSMTVGATYYYRAVYEWYDARGQRFQSGDSGPSAAFVLTAANQSNTITIPSLMMTRKTRTNTIASTHQTGRGAPVVAIYRTLANPASSVAPFYRVAEVEVSRIADTLTYVDAFSDASIVTNEELYLVSGELEHLAPAACHLMAEGNGRVFLAGNSEAPNTVYYSLTRQAGDPLAFNDALSFQISDFGGPITGLAVMTDHLLVFKRTAVYRVRGVGPNNTLTDGGLFFEPELLPTGGVGCIGQRSIVVTAFGAMFQAERGFYLVDLGDNLAYAGEALQGLEGTDEVAEGNPVVGALVLPIDQQVRFTSATRMWVFDYSSKIWTVYTGQTVTGPSVEWRGVHTWPGVTVLYEDPAAVYVAAGYRIVLAWAKLGPTMQEDLRFRRFAITGESSGIVNIRVKVTTNYSASVRQTIEVPSLPDGPVLLRRRFGGGARVVSALRLEIDDNGSTLGSLSLNEIALVVKRRDTPPAR